MPSAPKQLERFRDRFSPAGAKDDSRDGEVLASAFRTDPRCFRRLEPLWRYYPQMLELADDVAAPWFLEFWHLVPTPAKAARVRAATVDRLLKRHGSAASMLPRC